MEFGKVRNLELLPDLVVGNLIKVEDVIKRCEGAQRSDVFVKMIPVIILERASHFLSNFVHVTAYRKRSGDNESCLSIFYALDYIDLVDYK